MAAFMASGRSTVAPSTTPSCRPAARFVTPRSLFNWGGRSAPPPPEFQYHDVVPPFPMSLVANTHLRGKLFSNSCSIAGRELRCCYKATVDGFSATDFHRRCDFKGPCVVVGRTAAAGGGVRFGGFSPEGYRSTDDYYDTLDAFLFYWPETDTDAAAAAEEEAAVVVLPK
uniref:TLDc domain-containing protein n=1 Tax=Oryza barthii TaxID=65489 RepID=A0A0D3HJP8_9ORYZ